MAAERFAIEQVGVGLDPGAAHGIPAAGADFFQDTRKGGWIGAADMLVDGGQYAPSVRPDWNASLVQWFIGIPGNTGWPGLCQEHRQ